MIAVFLETAMFLTLLALAATAGLHFDCSGPVGPDMSATAILARFGKDARRADVTGAEGRPVKGVVLYADDPARRLEITFWDDAQTAVESVTAGVRATEWTGPLGLHVGSPLADVVAANVHNFSISGFGWDYGGYLNNAWEGKLATPQNHCAVQVRFGLRGKAPKAISGERDLDSTMAAVKAADPHIDRLSIGWPLPAGVKISVGPDEKLGF